MNAFLNGKWGALARLPHLPFDGPDQCRLLPADKSPGAANQFKVKGESGPQNILAQQTEFAGLPKRYDQVLDCQRIFFANVDNTLGRARCKGSNNHSFNDGVRVAFEQAPVHIGPGVALIGVADEILAATVRLLGQEFPFETGLKPRPAPAAQARGLYLLNHPPGITPAEDVSHSDVAVILDVIEKTNGIAFLVTRKKRANLLFKERNVALSFDRFFRFLIEVEQVF